MHKMDDRAWIREDTLTMLLATARLMHLQKRHRHEWNGIKETGTTG